MLFEFLIFYLYTSFFIFIKLIKLIIKFLENKEFQSINEQKNQLKFKYKFLKFIINSVHYSVKCKKKEYRI